MILPHVPPPVGATFLVMVQFSAEPQNIPPPKTEAILSLMIEFRIDPEYIPPPQPALLLYNTQLSITAFHVAPPGVA